MCIVLECYLNDFLVSLQNINCVILNIAQFFVRVTAFCCKQQTCILVPNLDLPVQSCTYGYWAAILIGLNM